MREIFHKWIINTLSLLLTAALLPGIEVSILSAFVASAFLGLFNVLLRPILLVLTLPINILTLGLFTFVINGLMLYLVSGIIKGVEIQGFGWAVIGAALLSLMGWGFHALLVQKERSGVIELKQGRDGTWRSY